MKNKNNRSYKRSNKKPLNDIIVTNEGFYYNHQSEKEFVVTSIKEFCESYYDILKGETGGFGTHYSMTKEWFVARVMINVTNS